MKETVKIEVSLGVGMNQFFPETIIIEIEPEQEDNNNNNNFE
jgi:hypothetical protein